MAARSTLRFMGMLAPVAGAALTGCASTSHVTAYQEHAIVPAPLSLTLALDQGETLPFGIAPDTVAAAAAKAGFVLGEEAPRYRLALSAAAGGSDAGSYLPGAEAKAHPSWVARPDRNWRVRFAGGRVLRITAVLIDSDGNREVWRGTGTLRTSDPGAAAPELAREVLAKLPHG
jgi:hypothetical protein